MARMPSEVIDSNVLFVASAAQSLDGTPKTPTSDPAVLLKVLRWVSAFASDPARELVMDRPERTLWIEYCRKLRNDHYGRLVVQHKFDTGALCWVDLTYWSNGAELVAHLPDPELYRTSAYRQLRDRVEREIGALHGRSNVTARGESVRVRLHAESLVHGLVVALQELATAP